MVQVSDRTQASYAESYSPIFNEITHRANAAPSSGVGPDGGLDPLAQHDGNFTRRCSGDGCFGWVWAVGGLGGHQVADGAPCDAHRTWAE